LNINLQDLRQVKVYDMEEEVSESEDEHETGAGRDMETMENDGEDSDVDTVSLDFEDMTCVHFLHAT
jgi:hypothetical protein